MGHENQKFVLFKMKKPQIVRKYVQNIYPTKNLYLEFIKSFYNSVRQINQF
jgi:hypothetical protein